MITDYRRCRREWKLKYPEKQNVEIPQRQKTKKTGSQRIRIAIKPFKQQGKPEKVLFLCRYIRNSIIFSLI